MLLLLVSIGLSISLAFITVDVAFIPGKVFQVRDCVRARHCVRACVAVLRAMIISIGLTHAGDVSTELQ
jgi:hypothetical protein